MRQVLINSSFSSSFGFLLLILMSSIGKAENLLSDDSSFESGIGNLIASSSEQVRWEIDRNNAANGRKSAKIICEGDGRITSRVISFPSNQNGKPFTFSFYAKADREGVPGCLRMIKENWSERTDSPVFNLTREWKRYSLTASVSQGNYLVMLDVRKPGIVWVDAFQMEEGTNPTDYKNNAKKIGLEIEIPTKYSYVFFKEEKVPVQIFAEDIQGCCGSGKAKFSLKIVNCSNGKEVFKREQECSLKKGSFATEYSLTPNEYGCYYLTGTLSWGSESVTASRTFVIVVPPVDINKASQPFCGLTTDRFSPAYQRIGGGHWAEHNGHWYEYEKEKGKYTFRDISWFHANGIKFKLNISHLPAAPVWAQDVDDLADAKKRQITRPLFGFLPSNTQMEAWREFMHRFAVNYKGQADIIEIGGEDDLTFGNNRYYLQKHPEFAKNGYLVRGPDFDRYAQMIKIACEEIRKVDPTGKIGIVRPSGGDCPNYSFASHVIKQNGRLFDLLPLDCYCWPRYIGPEQSDTQVPEEFLPLYLGNALKICEEYGKGQNVYMSEFGYALDVNVPPDSPYAMEMVKRLARSYLIARMTPRVESLHWFHPSGCVEGGKYDYALWRQGMPMPTVPAYSAVSRIVENVTGVKELHLGGESKTVVFKKDGRADAAVWFVRGAGRLICSKFPENIRVVDVMGNPVVPVIEGMKTIFEITEFPVYFSVEGSDAYKTLLQTLSNAKMSCKPLKMCLSWSRSDRATLQLRNQAGENLTAKVSIKVGRASTTQDVTIAKDKDISIEVPLSKSPSTVHVQVDCGPKYDKVVGSYPFDFEQCKKITSSINIDGDLSEWTGRPFIEMKDRTQIMPPDPWIEWKGPEHFGAKVYTGWDETHFYLAAEVNDDAHFNKNPSYSIWAGDSLQFAFNPYSAGFESTIFGYGKGDSELGLALTNTGPTAGQWAGDVNIWKNAEYVVKRDEAARKTFYEMKIPLSNLKISASVGTVFGFGFVIFNDNTGAGANHYYQFCPGIAGGKKPSSLKRFELVN